jgi:ankyrin repeat protein
MAMIMPMLRSAIAVVLIFVGSSAARAAGELAFFDAGSRLSFAGSEDPAFPLHAAALRNHVAAVLALVGRGVDVDARDKEGRTPLMIAAAFGNAEVAEALLSNGSNPNAEDDFNGDTALHFAALAGYVPVAQVLLLHGADPAVVSDHNGETALHYAAVYGHRKMIEFLVAEGADKNARDNNGMTPLQYAMRRGRFPTVDLLLSLGARKDTLNEAVNAGDVARVLALLRHGADVNEMDLYGTPLHRAAATGQAGIALILIEAGADLEAEGEPDRAHPLHAAAISNRTEAAALLIERGAKVDAIDAGGRTPLTVAASFGSAAVAEVLLNRGADPRSEELTYRDGTIHHAALSGSIEVMRLLLSRGVDVNSQGGNGHETPLHYAAKRGQLAMVKYLIAAGADPLIRNDLGRTPYDDASTHRNLSVMEVLRPSDAR